jgi:glycosyltransferase involved in cell wall biosynthesis
MMNPSVTAAVIVQNEQSRLTNLLPALAWADEVLVVDGGSRDQTAATARSLGASVRYRPFDNFANQRNATLDMARGHWVFFVDADERPVAGLADEIRRRIRKTPCNAFRVPVRSTIFGRPFRFSGTQDDRPVRLVRHGMARWQGAVHETVEVRGQAGTLSRWLWHEAIGDFSAFLAKMHRYTTLAAQARVERGSVPCAFDAWFRPAREFFRRLVWKLGWLDGPQGWAFAALSGLSEWVLAREHLRRFAAAGADGKGHPQRSQLARADAVDYDGTSATVSKGWMCRAT